MQVKTQGVQLSKVVERPSGLSRNWTQAGAESPSVVSNAERFRLCGVG